MPRRLRAAMHREVFWRRYCFQVVRILALQAGNERDSHPPGKVRILAVGFLAAAPARVPEYVDVWRPDREAAIPVRAAVRAHGCVVLSANLGAIYTRNFVNQRLVERCGQTNRLRKDGRRAGAGDPVETLVPPGVFGNAEPGHRCRGGAPL